MEFSNFTLARFDEEAMGVSVCKTRAVSDAKLEVLNEKLVLGGESLASSLREIL